MLSKIQVRRGTDAEWTAENPVLAAGEFGFVTDIPKIVIGDGVTPYVDTEFATVPQVAMMNDLMSLATAFLEQVSALEVRVTMLESA